LENPFQVLTPEDMTPEDVKSLFVDVFEQFYSIREQGHSFLNGPRGCGKSMIFRYLLPDCQKLVQNCGLRDLPHFGALIRFKNTAPNITELRRLNNEHASIYLNEHILTLYVAKGLFETLARIMKEEEADAGPVRDFLLQTFHHRLTLCGLTEEPPNIASLSARETIDHIVKICDRLYANVTQYAKRLAWPSNTFPEYTGPLVGFSDFLHPVIAELRKLAFMPKGPVLLLLDDADYLSLVQTRILNSWVSTRTTAEVILKISTQLRYKTYSTLSTIPIQSPHDYREINIADIYTTKAGLYLSRVSLITKRRLELVGLSAEPGDFFPNDEKQEKEIKEIGQKIKEGYKTKPRGYRSGDDVTRYARPEYFRKLAGPSKTTPSYSYSGFEQLVHISSGIIRYFLEPAARMYDSEKARINKAPTMISPSTQDEVIRDESEKLMFSEFDKILSEEKALEESQPTSIPNDPGLGPSALQVRTTRLHNLIRVLGNTFYQKLVSNDAERRVFSIALSGTPPRDLVEIFELGVRYGYFHRSSIGNKDGTGRTRLYVLSRRLAPHFNLDPSSFAGYLFTGSDKLMEAIENPGRALRRVKRQGVSDYFESGQIPLFE
ncbi:MAG: ORC-CDC6 family AAA ATPase, partial [Phycisphaerae bacterium]